MIKIMAKYGWLTKYLELSENPSNLKSYGGVSFNYTSPEKKIGILTVKIWDFVNEILLWNTLCLRKIPLIRGFLFQFIQVEIMVAVGKLN